MFDMRAALLVVVIAAVTMMLRVLPFVVFWRRQRNTSLYNISVFGFALFNYGNVGCLLLEKY